jgi:hypothetical protein
MLALLLPLILGILGWVLKPLVPFSVALLFGGVAYLPFAIGISFLIRRVTTRRQLELLTVISPLAFGAWAGAVGAVFAWLDHSDITGFLGVAYALAGVAFGYFYVVLAWTLHFLFGRVGLLRDEFAT